MRDRQLLTVFLVLNLALAGACVTFIAIAHQPPNVRLPSGIPVASLPPTSAVMPLASSTGPEPSHPSTRRYDWRDVWSPSYPQYLERLRQAGCPEAHIAGIAIRDVDEFYASRLLEAAVAHDHEWWRSETPRETLPALQTFAEAVEIQRARLLTQLLGTSRNWRRSGGFWEIVPLTGAVLGGLPLETHRQVQAICRRGFEFCQSSSRTDAVKLAEAEQQLRRALAAVLSPGQLEEFLLRYSPSSSDLRRELIAFGPTEDEFRKLFAALDPVDQRLRLEYGDIFRLGSRQREQHQALRRETIRGILTVARFEAYLRACQPQWN